MLHQMIPFLIAIYLPPSSFIELQFSFTAMLSIEIYDALRYLGCCQTTIYGRLI